MRFTVLNTLASGLKLALTVYKQISQVEYPITWVNFTSFTNVSNNNNNGNFICVFECTIVNLATYRQFIIIIIIIIIRGEKGGEKH